MKKPLDHLLREARGPAPVPPLVDLPHGFATRVVARWQADRKMERDSGAGPRIWTQTCLIGAFLTFSLATVVHFQTKQKTRDHAAEAWALIDYELSR